MDDNVRELLDTYLPGRWSGRVGRIARDTTQFMGIQHGDVIAVGGRRYLVQRDEAERRFGLEDPKYWVKRCTELESGEPRILKLEFLESFPMRIGSIEITCYRSPLKEARILDLTRGDLRFMQGFSADDEAGNNVRVIEPVAGKRLDLRVEAIEADHETYVREHLPGILERFVEACEAIAWLHARGEQHGDVRRDHLYVSHKTGRYCWIDFDYAYESHENPWGLDVFGLGNILAFLVGKGEITLLDLRAGVHGPRALSRVREEDFSLFFPHRLANLAPIFPYLPGDLCRVLQHFSAGTEVYYETVEELLSDLRPCAARLAGA